MTDALTLQDDDIETRRKVGAAAAVPRMQDDADGTDADDADGTDGDDADGTDGDDADGTDGDDADGQDA